MWTDALLAYLHFIAVFILFAFLSIELWLVRAPLDGARVRELCRANQWYWGAAAAVLATGLARLAVGAKGAAFHAHDWPLYAKLALFAAVLAMCLGPSQSFRRWRRAGTGWSVPEAERAAVRRRLMQAVHLVSVVPLLAAFMARGLS